MKILVGAGGWAYFDVPGDHLSWYSKAFDIVEVNSTFYELPDMRQVKVWRKKVREDFEFTVRCNRDLTHVIGLRPVEEAYSVFDKMKNICKILKADKLHLQTSKKSRINLFDVQSFFSSINTGNISLVWEVRGEKSMTKDFRNKLYKIMQENNITHCVDLSKDEPAYENPELVYTRLFGRGEHNLWQFTDQEIKNVNTKIVKQKARIAVVIAHTKKMYLDAARLKKHAEDGTFLRTTKKVGVEAVTEVLREDALFPCTKNQLILSQGWKVVDITLNRRERVSNVLKKIPNKTYKNLQTLEEHLMKLNIN